MGALGAIWGNVWSAAQAAGQNVLNAAGNAAVQGVAQVREAAGSALQETGIGLGAQVAPAGTTPRAVGWFAQNWQIVALGGLALGLVFFARGER